MRNCVRCPTGDREGGQAPPPAGGLLTRDTSDGSARKSKAPRLEEGAAALPYGRRQRERE